jgi:CDP-glycerol glycerophosphotransferase (TagB/SpsB family)
MQYLRYLALFISRFVLVPVYFLSGLVPRRRQLWVFGSWGGYRYADNAAAFFEYCQRRISDRVTLVWISRGRQIVADLRRRGYTAHYLWSVRGMVACLRAGAHLFDCFAKDTNFWLSRGALKINLWSGVPLKAFERDIATPGNRYYRLFHGNPVERAVLALMMPWHVEKPDLILATAPETAAITARAFAIPADHVVVTGFPRDDILFRDGPQSAGQPVPAALKDAVAAGRKVFFYMPTFRDSGRPYARIDWQRLDALMGEVNGTFLYKFHPMDRGHFEGNFRHIAEFPQDRDVYDLLHLTDALISDYSSIIFDYLLLNRPIILYTPDLAEFVSGERALNFQPQEIAERPLCHTYDELADALRGLATGAAATAKTGTVPISPVLSRLQSYADGRASERVLEAIDQRFFAGALRN